MSHVHAVAVKNINIVMGSNFRMIAVEMNEKMLEVG